MNIKLKKSVVFFLFFCAILSYTFSVNAQVMFQKAFLTSNLHEVKQTADSGFIAVGWNNLPGTQDVILIKTNALGDTLWTKIYGETEDVIGFSVDITSDGGYILLGGTYSTPLENPKVYLIKTDSLGDTLWTKKYGGSGTEWGREIHQTFDGGYIIAGETNSFGAGSDDIYIIKADSLGNIQWSRAFGGVNLDRCYSICQTSDSNFVAVGIYNAGSLNSDIVIIKMNAVGDTLWCRAYGDSLSEGGTSVKQTFNHGLAIAGSTMGSGSGATDFLLMITDSIGELSMLKTYGGIGGESASNIIQTSDSGYAISGYASGFGTSNASYIIRTDYNGNLIWSSVYNVNQYGVAWHVEETLDGGFITAGEQNELMKLSSNGITGCLENTAATISTTPTIPALTSPISVTISNTLSSGTTTTIGSGVSILTYCLSINNLEINPVSYFPKIFPNPASTGFSIQINLLSTAAHLEIYNILGERIKYYALTETLSNINCQQISSGIYFVKVFDGENQFSEKLIIEND